MSMTEFERGQFAAQEEIQESGVDMELLDAWLNDPTFNISAPGVLVTAPREFTLGYMTEMQRAAE